MGCGTSQSDESAGSGEAADSTRASSPSDYQKLNRILGQGMSCKVLLVKQKSTGIKCAMKKMKKSKELPSEKLWKAETKLLRTLSTDSHPHILKLVDSFSDSSSFYLVTQFCEGGELFDKLASADDELVTEKTTAKYTCQMLKAILHCHKNNIVHRDIKPENFVFETTSDGSMKLIDFGCAKVVEDEKPVEGVCGSMWYMAPEVVKVITNARSRAVICGKTWKAADMWSIGIIIYMFLVGIPPFYDEHTSPVIQQQAVFKKIVRGKYGWPAKLKISDSVKDLVRKLLVNDPNKRLTAEQALAHPWTQGHGASDEAIPANVLKNIASFQKSCKLKKAVGRVLSNQMTDEDKEQVKDLFQKFDKNGDGKLGGDEIKELMNYVGQGKMGIEDFLKEIDEDGDGNVELEELEAVQGMEKVGDNVDEMKTQFDMFDHDKSGYVTAKELENVMGMEASEIKSMIDEVDASGDGRINFEEWMAALGKKRNTVELEDV
jgi:calcium-dependent protein kinase